MAGVLIATVGSGWCFLINAASFLFVLAGLETVTSALSTAFAALAARPEVGRLTTRLSEH